MYEITDRDVWLKIFEIVVQESMGFGRRMTPSEIQSATAYHFSRFKTACSNKTGSFLEDEGPKWENSGVIAKNLDETSLDKLVAEWNFTDGISNLWFAIGCISTEQASDIVRILNRNGGSWKCSQITLFRERNMENGL